MQGYVNKLERAVRELERLIEQAGELEGRVSDARLDRVAPALEKARGLAGGEPTGEQGHRWHRVEDELDAAYGYLYDAEDLLERVSDKLGYAQSYIDDAVETLKR